MHIEDSPVERAPDFVAKIRALRQQAEKQMDQFTCVADYDVRHVVGRGTKAAPVSDETVTPSPAAKRAKKGAPKSVTNQTSMEFPPAPAERGTDDGEEA